MGLKKTENIYWLDYIWGGGSLSIWVRPTQEKSAIPYSSKLLLSASQIEICQF